METMNHGAQDHPEGVAFVMTQALKQQLRDLGCSTEQIREMTPGEAHAIVREMQKLRGSWKQDGFSKARIAQLTRTYVQAVLNDDDHGPSDELDEEPEAEEPAISLEMRAAIDAGAQVHPPGAQTIRMATDDGFVDVNVTPDDDVDVAKAAEAADGTAETKADKDKAGSTFKAKPKHPKPIDFTKHATTGVKCPMELLPKVIRDLAENRAYLLQCAPEMIVIPALCAAGGMLGHAVRVQPKWADSSWTERPAIWGAVVAPPSSMKTPAANAAMAPVTSLQRHRYFEHQAEKEAFKAALAEYKAAPKNDKPLLPQEPVPAETILIDDTTTERAAMLMSSLHNSNRRGLIIFADELSGWLRGFNQYKNGRGNDRPFWLKTWSGGAHNHQRVNTDSTFFIPECYVSLFGGIQPEVAQTLFGTSSQDDDGMIQRFGLVVTPNDPGTTVPRDEPPNAEIQRAYQQRLLELREVPEQLVKFSQGAAALFATWESNTRNSARALGGAPLGTHILKYTALLPRLALVWHFLEHGKNAPSEISPETFELARRFIDEYVKPHAERLYGMLEEHACKAAAGKVAEWILKKHKTKFTARDIRHNDWREFNREDDRLLITATLNYLEAMNWVELREVMSGVRGGRPTIEAHVNPRVFEAFPDGLGK
jgi:hypothetical protein